MLIVEIDVIHIEPLEASLASGANISRVSSDQHLPILEENTKLGG
jgi:hypothetical protein